MTDTKIPQDAIDDLELVRAVLQGFQDCTPKQDGLAAYGRLKMHIEELRDQRQAERIEALETLRPLWAMGFSDDSVAAQTTAAALAQIWGALGVTNQTDCIAKLKELVAAPTQPSSNAEEMVLPDAFEHYGHPIPPAADAKPDVEAFKVRSKFGNMCMFESTSVKKGDTIYTHPSNDAMRKALVEIRDHLDPDDWMGDIRMIDFIDNVLETN